MKSILFICLSVIVLTGCENTRYAYSPAAHNVPVFTKQGDSKLAADYSNNGAWAYSDYNSQNQYDKKASQGIDLQGAFAVTKHIGIQANYFYRKENTNSTYNTYNFDSSAVKYRRNMADFGAGFFSALDTKDKVLFQVYAGMGLGKTTISDKGKDQNQSAYSRYYNTDITKFYLEPSVTFRAREVFAGSIATRLSLIKFRNINSNYTFQEKQDLNLDSLDRFAVVFFEPAFVGSFGFNKLPGFRIEIQAGLSLLLDESFVDYRPFNFSAGLVFDIRKLLRGRTK